MATTSAPAPGSGPNAGGGAGGGDPVDLGSGLFVYRKTDLTLPDAIPATLQRIYRPGDSNIYGFGQGTTTPYDIRLWNVNSYTVVQMVLPDGGTINFDRTSPGEDWQSGVFEQRTTPGPWFGAVIRRMPNVDGWQLQRRDGTVYEFASGYGPVTAIQDPDGNRLTIDRSQGTTGLATKITTQHGRWMRFTYNASSLATSVVDKSLLHLRRQPAAGDAHRRRRRGDEIHVRHHRADDGDRGRARHDVPAEQIRHQRARDPTDARRQRHLRLRVHARQRRQGHEHDGHRPARRR
jgi:hypothetical protein